MILFCLSNCIIFYCTPVEASAINANYWVKKGFPYLGNHMETAWKDQFTAMLHGKLEDSMLFSRKETPYAPVSGIFLHWNKGKPEVSHMETRGDSKGKHEGNLKETRFSHMVITGNYLEFPKVKMSETTKKPGFPRVNIRETTWKPQVSQMLTLVKPNGNPTFPDRFSLR